MTEVQLARAEVRPGKADRLREWYAELETRTDEVVETLAHEGVVTETAFLGPDGAYLYVYMEAEDLATADDAGDEEAFDVDEEHHDVLAECLTEGWTGLETVGHFTNPELR